MGVFEVSEANRKAKCLEIKAYDYMVRFEKVFTSLVSIGNAYDFMVLCSTACEVTLAQDRATIEALPNRTENLSMNLTESMKLSDYSWVPGHGDNEHRGNADVY